MHDAHFHFSEKLFRGFTEHRLQGICSCASPSEVTECRQRQEQYRISASFPEEKNGKADSFGLYLSAGIHPWDVDKLCPEEMLPYLESAEVIGEIGLDSVWCETDPEKQREIFSWQLSIAEKEGKPVILHLKGMEEEALPFLKAHPNRYLVHWYSRKEYLEEYLSLGCCFTIGPSVDRDPAVREVAERLPLERLLLESDGIAAVAWARGCREEEISYPRCLWDSLREIAELRGMDAETVEALLDRNFRRFLSGIPENASRPNRISVI